MKRFLVACAVIIVLIAVLTQEVECRRKILKGRKTVNRTYFRQAAIPGWAVVVLTGVCELIVGGIAFFILKKTVLDVPTSPRYIPARTAA